MRYDEHYDWQEQRIEKREQYTVLTPSDVMDILGVGKNTAYDLLNSGKLKGFRVGRGWRITGEALEEFMTEFPKGK